MNDLDTFRAALRDAPPDLDFVAGPDLDGIMTAGGRIRRRRRLAIGAGALAVTAVLVGGVQLAVPSGAPPSSVAGQPSAPASASAAEPSPARLGDLIVSGMAGPAGEWVFYLTPVDLPERPEVSFGVMAANRSAAGIVDRVMTNEISGADRDPGFHAVQAGMITGEDDVPAPAFGYYVGPVAKITAKLDRRTVTAGRAAWSEDPNVVVFWFDPAKVGDSFVPENLTAYDANGRRLPAGNTRPGVG